MKKILKQNTNYLILLFLIISIFLISCGGITPTDYTIIATAGAGGSISPSGAVSVSDGGSSNFTITPNEGYLLSDVLIDGVSIGAVVTYTFTNVDQGHTISATFISGSSEYKVKNIDTEVGYDTIQEAIDASSDGETIVVSPGIYYESIEFTDKNITLQSSAPLNPAIVAATIIDGDGDGSVVKFNDGDTSTLKGFTIQNGNAEYGGGINIYLYSSPIIENNIISANNSYKGGGGIYIYKNSFPTITGNMIIENEAGIGMDGGGAGIFVYDHCSPTISSNIIKDNKTMGAGGGIHVFINSSPNIIGNTISSNEAGGGGIAVNHYSSPTIKDNTISNNTGILKGGGISVAFTSNMLPTSSRPTGWGSDKENIPTGDPLNPAEGVIYIIAGNEFVGNKHEYDDTLEIYHYTESAHVWFQSISDI